MIMQLNDDTTQSDNKIMQQIILDKLHEINKGYITLKADIEELMQDVAELRVDQAKLEGCAQLQKGIVRLQQNHHVIITCVDVLLTPHTSP
jgi:hypothetical protein